MNESYDWQAAEDEAQAAVLRNHKPKPGCRGLVASALLCVLALAGVATWAVLV